MKPCPDCRGRGWYYVESTIETAEFEQTCDTCKGSGDEIMTITKVTFNEFVTKFVQSEYLAHGQRKGQLAFNLLYECHPQLAEEIRTGDHDPFYADERLPMFWSYVAIHWDD